MLKPLFEDNHLIVVNKPAGLLTQPSKTDQDSLEYQVKAWIKVMAHKPGQVFLEAVHRLDKAVSGIVVFGKTSKALSRLNASIRLKQLHKIYWAWVEGVVPMNGGNLKHFLLHDHFQAIEVDPSHPKGKIAQLSYKVLQRKKERTLLEIDLITGRYHQIRFQLASLGYPIFGDHKYGGKQQYRPEAIALHHRRLQLPHPISQLLLTFEAPLPSSFIALGQNEDEI